MKTTSATPQTIAAAAVVILLSINTYIIAPLLYLPFFNKINTKKL